MPRFLVIAVVAGLVAWQLGWWSPRLNVPGMVSDRANCDPSYPSVCVSSPPPYLGCEDLSVSKFKVFGSDPHGFDPDDDGFGCN